MVYKALAAGRLADNGKQAELPTALSDVPA